MLVIARRLLGNGRASNQNDPKSARIHRIDEMQHRLNAVYLEAMNAAQAERRAYF
jgi:hypothetical protein